MTSRSTSRFTAMGAVVALSVATIAGAAGAQQVQQPAPPHGTAPGTAPKPSMSPAEQPKAGQVEGTVTQFEGTVKKVDPGAQTVEITSESFGMTGRTLEVNDRTAIEQDGRQATLADIQEGAKVKASYDAENGKNVATRIELLPAKGPDTGSSPAPSSGTAPRQ